MSSPTEQMNEDVVASSSLSPIGPIGLVSSISMGGVRPEHTYYLQPPIFVVAIYKHLKSNGQNVMTPWKNMGYKSQTFIVNNYETSMMATNAQMH